MRSTLLFIQVVALLLWWDLVMKLRVVFSSDAGRAYVDAAAKRYARRLLSQARAMVGIRLISDIHLIQGQPSPFLILSNHQSVLDIVAIMAAFESHSVRFIAKAELGSGFPAVSQVLRSQRHALINRDGDVREAMTRIERLARRCRGTMCPVVFPEGTRSRDGDVGAFHSGAVRRILQGQVMPVVALAVDGGTRVARLSDVVNLPSHHEFRLRAVQVFPAPTDKRTTLSTIESARHAIVAQVDAWRRNARV